MAKVRVVLANMPQIPTHIVRDLVNRQPDLAVVGEVRRQADLPTLVASRCAQAVILTFSPPSTGMSICCPLRERYPALTLLEAGSEERPSRGVDPCSGHDLQSALVSGHSPNSLR